MTSTATPGADGKTPLVAFPVVALIGPTAVGKTALSLRLARELNADIVSVDSVQVYRGLDIGTAKPTRAEKAMVTHHLIDIVDPDEPFDATDFARIAQRRISVIRKQKKNVLLVGGTGLYLRALVEGLAPCPGQNPVVRAELNRIASEKGRGALHQLLKDLDPVSAARLHPHDTFRVVRALEVYSVTGEPISVWQARRRREGRLSHPCIKFGLVRSRQELYRRIDHRVDVMIAQGLLKEVRGLLDRGYHPELKPLRSLGYRHMIQFLRGALSWEETVRQMKRDSRHYAKRQLTWFRADPEVQWLHPEALDRARRIWPAIWSS